MTRHTLRRCTLVCPALPWPARSGGLVRVARIAEWLAGAGVPVEVLSLDGDLEAPPPTLASVRVLRSRRRPTTRLRRIAAGAPPAWTRAYDADLSAATRDAITRGDTVIVAHPYTMVNVPRRLWPAVVLDSHNLETARTSSFAAERPGSLAALAVRSVCRFERALLRDVGLFLVCSDEERELALGLEPHARVAVVPNGAPHVAAPPPLGPHGSAYFMGKLDYKPNADALRWLLSDIWPRVLVAAPSAHLTLLGSGACPPELARRVPASVTLDGEVEDACAAIARHRACLVPLRSGGGTRVKILEAAALGRPVVATSIGAAGLGLDAAGFGSTDAPQEFAARTARLLENDREASRVRELLLRWVAPRRWPDVLDRHLLPVLAKHAEAIA
jgi:glycosyltransferase involved in cell wall biosynthesis